MFVTFETEEGFYRAVALKDYPEISKFLPEQKLVFKKAVEPSDIIWENRHITKVARKSKKWVVISTLAAALLFSFLVIFYGTKW